MRWVCILFPQLALDAVLRQRPDPDEPLVLLNGPAQRRCCKRSTRRRANSVCVPASR